jgi:hypothetical protein
VTRPEDPLRLCDDPDAAPEVVAALRGAQARAPNDAQLAEMASALGFFIPPTPSGAPPPPAAIPPASIGLGKIFGGIGMTFGAAAAVTTAVMVASPSEPAPREERRVERTVEEVHLEEAPPFPIEPAAEPAREIAAERAVPPRRRRHRVASAPAPAEVIAPPPSNPFETTPLSQEAALVDRAERLLRSNPAGALRLTEERRRRFPSGALDQEAEVVAIDALLRLGRRDVAERRARIFEAAHGGSLHARRIRRLITSGR